MSYDKNNSRTMSRRTFIKTGAGAAALAALDTRGDFVKKAFGKSATRGKVLVLGFDGMDPHLTGVWMKEGKLPAFQKLAARGGFSRLGTSTPPQSPVAWSNFITGMNPGGHGIFDFMHRDPKTYFPIFSASATDEAAKTVRIGKYVLPIKGGEVRNLRKGRAFWQILEDHDIPATIWKIPGNYPPVATKQRTLSGMGTPDLVGSYGIFNYYTTELLEMNEDIGGGKIHLAYVIGNRVDAKLPGPVNTFLQDRPEAEVDFRVYLDSAAAVAKVALPDQEFILKEKEWSGWKRVRFHLMPTQSVTGLVRFYLKEIRPQFKLYVTPINIDPADPALPISTPESYAAELEKKFGPFYTKGLPADTSALDNDVLDEGEFLAQDGQILEESRAMLEYELNRFDSGLLFYYISSTDQRQHMFWRLQDEKHPAYDAALAAVYGDVIERTYRQADEILAQALSSIDKDTSVIVMSDHGFNPYYRSFHLNTWLLSEGYHVFKNPFKKEETEIGFPSTDWSKTRAYGLGLNSLYLNQRGREGEGIVAAGAETEALVREIARKLEAYRDPKTNEQVVLHAAVARDVYSGAHVGEAPDIILGFNRGYRISFQSPLGRIGQEIIENNTEKWSGDHMGAADVTPGIVLTDRPIRAEAPALYDLTATILQTFGIERPADMVGKPIF
ncbi:MAG: alkaline phosphatase family protein [Candidatus Aminicenantes bacterium]|nr:alkaline phosphatase family protein [Candidatus Aminicenantes bacterium]